MKRTGSGVMNDPTHPPAADKNVYATEDFRRANYN